MADTHLFAQLVVVGSSAGGIEALSTLVGSLPADFAAPLVIAQHIDPARPSHLGEILGRRGKLPVRTVEEETLMEPGVVYVVPANRQVEITDGHVRLRTDNATGPRPSVDLLLSSAAQAYGERLVAVILTGSGSDGAAGAREVSAAGGTVIIQNPETASYPSMPQSLAPTIVDIIADIEHIGPILYDLVSGARVVVRPTEERALRAFLEQLRARSGIDFNAYKMPTIMRRLQRRMLATNAVRLADYIRFIGNNPDEYQRLISSFLIKVTEFFRDADLFAHLRDHTLPRLIADARLNDNELRLWSAGCATGEEPYSLAILLSDLLGDELAQFNVRIFATDLDNEAINFARRGIYPAAALVNLPPEMVERYFTRLNGDFEVKKQVRALTVFGQHDLGQRAPFPRIDLELCRNVLIYFTPQLQERALQLFTFSLRDGGYLVLGKSETTNPLADYFVMEDAHLKIYRRQGERTLFPPSRYRDVPATPPLRLVGGTRAAVNGEQSRVQRETQRSRIAREKFEELLLGLPLGVVVVDRRYDIQAINGAARRMFGVHSAAIGEDFLHLAQTVPPAPLRTAIDAAFRGEAPVTAEEIAATEIATGDMRYFEIACYPQKVGNGTEAVDSALVTVQDTTERVQERRALEESLARQRAESERTATLMKRLAEVNRQLLDANQDLANGNAELRGANEEFLVVNEEAQAATEEIETLNEELQATNEELETLNEELQATVEELNTTNDDLQARTAELQEIAVSLELQRHTSEGERERMAAILGSIGDAVLVVDRVGKRVMANDRYTEMFGAPDDPFVAEDEDGHPLPPDQTPQQRVASGESFAAQFTITAPDGSRRWFEATGRPVSQDTQQIGVLVIRDITERSLRRMQDEFMAIASHELRTPLTGLSGYLQMLLRLYDADENTAERPRRYATLALGQSQRLLALINELLDVARLQNGQLMLVQAPIDLVAVVRRAVETAQLLTQTQTIGADIADDPVTLNGDDRRLEQVILNLLTNAISHAAGSACIDVRLRVADGQATLDVQDYGPGIAPADLTNIFSRFYRAERAGQSPGGGLGLGLYIAREIVVAHGGTLDVRSTLGEGTTFTVRLPLGES
ncbi:MAG: ATP-binding protein [Chloroflexota bacterium]|nr:ATP-binding protein [Chloroflexota bacterium]